MPASRAPTGASCATPRSIAARSRSSRRCAPPPGFPPRSSASRTGPGPGGIGRRPGSARPPADPSPRHLLRAASIRRGSGLRAGQRPLRRRRRQVERRAAGESDHAAREPRGRNPRLSVCCRDVRANHPMQSTACSAPRGPTSPKTCGYSKGAALPGRCPQLGRIGIDQVARDLTGRLRAIRDAFEKQAIVPRLRRPIDQVDLRIQRAERFPPVRLSGRPFPARLDARVGRQRRCY